MVNTDEITSADLNHVPRAILRWILYQILHVSTLQTGIWRVHCSQLARLDGWFSSWLLSKLADVSLIARQLVPAFQPHPTVFMGRNTWSRRAYSFLVVHRRKILPNSCQTSERGNTHRLFRSSPGRSTALGIDGFGAPLGRQTEVGRLGTPRLQACLDRSSPVSDFCGLVMGVEDSPTQPGGVLQRRCAADYEYSTLETLAAFKLFMKSSSKRASKIRHGRS